MLNGIAGANLIRRQRLALIIKQACGVSTALANDPAHAALVPQVAEMKRLKRLARGKKKPAPLAVGIDPTPLNPSLFDFQAACVDFALRQGRCGLYLDTGLGKTFCQLEWAEKALQASNGYALILTPLAVARQMEREALARGYDARVIREQRDAKPGINICNYDRMDKIDPDRFGVVSLDEASILKNFSGKTTRAFGSVRRSFDLVVRRR